MEFTLRNDFEIMNIIPSIDLMNGKCVRLCNGKQDTAVYYDINPIDYINNLVSYGINHIHIVDLDKAFGHNNADNIKVIKDILAQIKGITIDIGGGIHTKLSINEYLNLGASKICLGTLTIDDPQYVKEIIKEFGADKFIFCPDVSYEYVATHGWQIVSDVHILDYLDYWCKNGIKDFICTVVENDGTFSGPDIPLYSMLNKEFKEKYNTNIIASGGISNIEDIVKLKSIGTESIIIGKALFENKINLGDLTNV